MKPPKQKPPMSKPKTLKKTVRSLGGIKKNIDKTADTIKKTNKAQHSISKHMPSEQKQHRPEEYATDSITEKTSNTTKKIGGKTVKETKYLAQKGAEKIRGHRVDRQQSKYDTKFEADVKKKQSDTAKQSSNKTQYTADKANKKTKSAIHTGNKTNKTVKTGNKTVKSGSKAVKTSKKSVKTAKKATKAAKSVAKKAKRAAIIAKKSRHCISKSNKANS